MKKYAKNIVLYLAALCGLLAFIGLFTNALKLYDSIKDSWSIYNVKAYIGESVDGNVVYRGAIIPIFGFVLPLLLSIILIIESFKAKWVGKLKKINTTIAVLYFLSGILVLLTKDVFLSVNKLGETLYLRNGSGPIFSAICSWIAAILLLLVTWIPSHTEVEFIER